MIKYKDDCPNKDYKNTFVSKPPLTHNYIIWDTFNEAMTKLKLIPYKQYAKIIEFDLKATKEIHPTEHFLLSRRERKELYVPENLQIPVEREF